MQILTRAEARERRADVDVHSVDVHVDLSGAADVDRRAYPVTSSFSMTCRSGRTFVDVVGEVDSVLLDGSPHAFDRQEDRVEIAGLPGDRPFRLDVVASCRYSRTGEGLHRYVDPEDGRVYLYTQFEPNDAHRAWPCFDQPDIKPRWAVDVIAPADWTVASNGAERSREERPDGTALTSFTRTGPLSSYITALVAGPWEVVDGGRWNGGAGDGRTADVRLRLLCRRALAPYMDADDILAVTRAGLDFFHARYGTTYPWGDYDQVFVPEYNLGAMENPGCVTFNETYLSRERPTFAERQRRANTILHEMCHMWFGDLATPAWWDDLWLKESFAENQGTEAASTATEYAGEWASFAIGRKAWAYEQDQLPTTHPIAADIPDVAAAKTNFDGITYAKGAAVLRQLVAWVGEDAFYAAARRYFAEHAWGATGLDDLIGALEAETGLPLDGWRRAWLDTTGPSVLTASWTPGPDGQVRDFRIRQEPTDPDRTLRPHRVVVSTWAMSDGRLERTGRFDVRLDGPDAPVDPDGLLDRPGATGSLDLVVVNDEDRTYAVARLDERSADTALASISACDDPLTRAVVWASLWNGVRDGLLDPERFADAAIAHAPYETEGAVRDRLLALAHEAVSSYLPGPRRAAPRARILSAARDAAQSTSGDERRAWTRALVLEYLATGDAPTTPLIESLADSDDLDLAWRARIALAAHGRADGARLDAWLAADPTGEAKRHRARALAAIPTAPARAAAWEEVRAGTLSNDLMTAVLAGLADSSWDGPDDRGPALDEMRRFWEEHSIGLGIRYVRGVLDRGLDVADPASVEATAGALRRWLDGNADAPDQLTRLVVEALDGFERRIRVQDAAR
ncbi:aminopeptidase N [Actinomyces sp. B33]|uniref:aminopeptidase N n=1 Tax=Actinomyces sp. B33 TaxID=2942131 RepID=UPI00234046A6|nr:aminopeptidase N [Actinomyces sp. B33]MDC4233301.1 aminopeptidase N [Actinomyces sp. B33]